jgi:NhaC family Na+:H+ antiporter
MASATEGRKPTLLEALIVILFAAGFIGSSVLVWHVDVHIPIAMSACFAALMGRFVLKMKWSHIEEGMLNGIMMAMQAILILFIIGMVIGSWIQGGVVPTLIYYGLDILSPTFFLLATFLICSIVALSTGTSWGTSGTVGIALMGIAAGLGIPAPLTAGIIISGAYFGDKMSPLSDTTNLAPAVAGTDLFQHIRAMVWTTGPTYHRVRARCSSHEYAGLPGCGEISAFQTRYLTIPRDLAGYNPPVTTSAVRASAPPFRAALRGRGRGRPGSVRSAATARLMSWVSPWTATPCPLRVDPNARTERRGQAPGGQQHRGGGTGTGQGSGSKRNDLLTRAAMMSMSNTIALITCALSFGANGAVRLSGMCWRAS